MQLHHWLGPSKKIETFSFKVNPMVSYSAHVTQWTLLQIFFYAQLFCEANDDKRNCSMQSDIHSKMYHVSVIGLQLHWTLQNRCICTITDTQHGWWTEKKFTPSVLPTPLAYVCKRFYSLLAHRRMRLTLFGWESLRITNTIKHSVRELSMHLDDNPSILSLACLSLRTTVDTQTCCESVV